MFSEVLSLFEVYIMIIIISYNIVGTKPLLEATCPRKERGLFLGEPCSGKECFFIGSKFLRICILCADIIDKIFHRCI